MKTLLLIGTALVAAASPALAQTVTIAPGEGRVLHLAAPADSVSVSRPEVADVQMPTPTTMFVFGKSVGQGTVTAVSRSGAVLQTVDLVVAPNVAPVNAMLSALPGANASANAVDGGIVLDGTVATAADSAAANAAAVRAVGGKPELVRNRLGVAMAPQVNLRVRIAEVERSVARELGFNFEILGKVGSVVLGAATGRTFTDLLSPTRVFNRAPTGADNYVISSRTNSLDFNGVIDALEGDGLVSVLAEPNLTARSGETASFLSGGEFPIPIDNRDRSITVEFKKYGVALDFTPTVIDGGRISLHVRPEVSQLDPNSGVEINGIKIPGLRVRRADTTVELASGQSFAIAGLLQSNAVNSVRQTPGLGNIPILGALFRSTRFQKNETELVIMVTPYLVQGAASPRLIATPFDSVKPAISFESLFLGRIAEPGRLPKGGDTGFIVE